MKSKWMVGATGIRHRVVRDVTYCGKYARNIRSRKPKADRDCLRCDAVYAGRYVESVALGHNKKVRV